MTKGLICVALLTAIVLSGCSRQYDIADVTRLYDDARASLMAQGESISGLNDPTELLPVKQLATAVCDNVLLLKSIDATDRHGRHVIYAVFMLIAKESPNIRQLSWEESAMLSGIIIRGSSTEDLRWFIVITRAATLHPWWRHVVGRHISALAAGGIIDKYWLERMN